MRAVIYARYSTDLQREASIEDQVRLCKERIDARGVATHCHIQDARSAAPASSARLSEAARGCARWPFDIVVAEALDRLVGTRSMSPGSTSNSAFAGSSW